MIDRLCQREKKDIPVSKTTFQEQEPNLYFYRNNNWISIPIFSISKMFTPGINIPEATIRNVKRYG